MRIRNEKDVENVASVIGDQNVEASMKALKDGAMIWVFQSETEVKDDQELTEKEKQFCLNRFATGETWAGIFRTPLSIARALYGLSRDHDPHGNPINRNGGGNSHDSIH